MSKLKIAINITLDMIQWLLFLMFGEGLAELTCSRSSSTSYFVVDLDTCRAPDMNTYFNDGANLMTQCNTNNGHVSICIWM